MCVRSAWFRFVCASAAAAASFLISPSAARAQGSDSHAQPAQRLVIHYDHGSFAIQAQYNLRKTLPPSEAQVGAPALDPAARSGFWFDIVTGDGSVLYRRIIANPIIRVVERPDPDDPANRPVREEAMPNERVFSLLVPQYPAESYPLYLIFYSSPLRPGAAAEPAAEIGRVMLQFEAPPIIQ